MKRDGVEPPEIRSVGRPAATNASRASSSTAFAASEVGADRVAVEVARVAADPDELERRAAVESSCASSTAPAALVWPVRCRPTSSSTSTFAFDAAARERGREPLGRGERVDGDGQLDVARDLGEALPLRLPERRVVDEDPRRARVAEDLRLAGLRHREPAGAELELAQADLGRLVRLRVRPERDAVLVAVGLQPGQVRLELVEVDDGDRRLDLGERLADLLLEQLQRAAGWLLTAASSSGGGA